MPLEHNGIPIAATDGGWEETDPWEHSSLPKFFFRFLPQHHPCRYFILYGHSHAPCAKDSWVYSIRGAAHTLAEVRRQLAKIPGAPFPNPQEGWGAYDNKKKRFVPPSEYLN